MARPTLSKVIYLQQLGRGTRMAPNKECLIVFDFVDNASRYNASLSLHRVLGVAKYRAGSLVLAPTDQLNRDQACLLEGQVPSQVLPVELWAQGYEEIDVFNWQEAVSGMLSASDMEVELAATEGCVRSAVERALVTPDHTLALGGRTYYYFVPERAEEIRATLGLPRVDDSSIRDLFLEFVTRMDMSSSYKPVLLLTMLESVDEHGRALLDQVVQGFQSFYLDRQKNGLRVERAGMRMERASDLSLDEVRSLMLAMPFRKFEQRKYVAYDREDLAFIRFQSPLWRQLRDTDRAAVRNQCEQAISDYYERIKP
jgi:hypothetical protein